MSDNEFDNEAIILVDESAIATAGAPVPEIERCADGRQVITLRDSTTGEVDKPEGVFGTEVFMKIANANEPAPVSIEEMELIDLSLVNRIERTFSAEDRSKVAWYGFRYVDGQGKPAPITTLVKAPIAA